ncbi:MAG: DUF4198 domain-containing protein [Moraxellaceae bacterium]|nr:DUF4198 domain-containing protein [Moraxellaceae bacterium]
MKRILTPLLTALCLLNGLSAHAHGIWFAERSGEFAMIYGHGSEDSNMVKRQRLVTSIAAYDFDGKAIPTALKATDLLLLVDMQNRPPIVAATLDNGYWTKGPDNKWVGKPKNEVPGAQESGQYVKYAVALRRLPDQGLPLIPGHALQIQPVDKPFPERMGDALRLRVLFDGKPAAGAKVTTDYVNDPDAKPLVADADGVVTVRIRNQGLNVVTAAFESKAADPAKADKVGHFASLSFVLKHLPE